MGLDICGLQPKPMTDELQARLDRLCDAMDAFQLGYAKKHPETVELSPPRLADREWLASFIRGASWRGWPPITEAAFKALGEGREIEYSTLMGPSWRPEGSPYDVACPAPAQWQYTGCTREGFSNDHFHWTAEQCEAAAKVQRAELEAEHADDPKKADGILFAHFLENCGGFWTS